MKDKQRKPYRGVKAWIVERGIRQGTLAKSLSTTDNYFNKKLNGTGPDFKLSEVRKLHDDFGIPIHLFFEIDVPFKEQSDDKTNV